MALSTVDTLIRTTRKNMGLTQEELCSSLCSKDELSRIERGKRRPHWWLFEQLMQRLGEDPQKYYSAYNAVFSKEEHRIMELRDELRHLLRDATRSNEAEALLIRIENDEGFKNKAYRQLLLKSKAGLAFNREDYTDMLKYAIEGIKITKPTFENDMDSIENYILTYDEIWLIQHIGIAYFYTSSYEKSTEVLFKLKCAIGKYNLLNEEIAKAYCAVLYNLSKNLGVLNRFDECISLCEEGCDICKKHRDSHLLPMFMFNKACCLLQLKQIEEGTKLVKEALTLFAVYERHAEIKVLFPYIESEFGIALI